MIVLVESAQGYVFRDDVGWRDSCRDAIASIKRTGRGIKNGTQEINRWRLIFYADVLINILLSFNLNVIGQAKRLGHIVVVPVESDFNVVILFPFHIIRGR